MATVTFNGTRLTDGNSNTGYTKLNSGGGAPAAEPQLAYRKPNVVNVKSTSSGFAGLQYAHSSTIDMDGGTHPLVLVKGTISDAGDLNATEGSAQYIGSSSGDYYRYNIAGSGANNDAYTDGYQSQGGLATNYVITAINPTIAQWREATVGSPDLNVMDYLAFVGSWVSGAAKTENLGYGPIDVATGLDFNGASFSFQDGVDFDQGTDTNRYGLSCANGPNISMRGKSRAGTVSATSGTDTSKVFWPDGYHGSGDAGHEDDTTRSSVVYDGAYESLGRIYGSDDTRGDWAWIGDGTNSATHGGTWINWRNFTLHSSQTLDGASIDCSDLTQAGAALNNTTIRCNSAVNIAVCDDFTVADTTNLTVIQEGAGHFVDYGTIAASTSIDWDVTLQGFPAGTTGDPATTTSNGNEAILVNVASGQTFTINVSGGTVPSVKNDGPGDVAIVSSVPVTVTVTFGGVPVEGAAVYIETTGNDVVLNGLTNASGVVSGSYGGATPATIDDAVSGVKSGSDATPFQYFVLGGEITSNGYTATALLSED